MTPARLQTVEEIFHAALDQEPEQTSAFLDTACEGDEALRLKVEALLASHQRAGSFIETTVAGITTRIIENEQADLLVGRTIGHYKISERIGTGGMGDVYLATDITAGRKAALKLLPTRFTSDAQRLKRFQQEERALVGLNHPNILTVYEIGQDHSTHYIASELIEGETLRQRLMRGRMELREAVDVAIQVVTALAAAHEAGIVHRDIKPENIMLRPDGYVKVLDFGIAKLAESAFAEATADGAGPMTLAETNLGSIQGTVRYMSPEQACGAPIDKRTDVWSLGVVLYEMITGHAPFAGDTPGEVMASILEKEPLPLARYVPRAPAELQQIISKTLRKDPAQRYHSAHELLHALKELRRKLEFKLQRAAAPLWLRWAQSPVALVVMLLAAALALTLPFFRHRNLTTSLPPEKSIAVLPLENLSDDKENAFFADGVQDELLSNLSKIKDLKVISRTSVMQYKSGTRRNLKEIAQQLGANNVVEGSVRRSGDHMRVSVQLIDARTDRHLWGENYDRALADSLSLQGELATEIAAAVGATLTPQEKARVEAKPTNNPAAYDAYLRARAIPVDWGFAIKGDIESAIRLYEQAVKLDPNFTLAWAYLSIAQIQMPRRDSIPAPAHTARAKDSLKHAVALDPNLPEVHLARGYNEEDCTRALAEFRQAEQGLPNSVDVIEAIARMQRALGHWDEAVADLRRAIELDPRNISASNNLALTYCSMRRFPEAVATLDRVLAWDPTNARALLTKADALMAIGDLQAAEPLLANPELPADRRARYALFQRNYAAAIEILSKDLAVDRPRRDPNDILLLGFSQQLAGDTAAARATYQKSVENFRLQLEKVEPDSGFEPYTRAFLGAAYAGLGEAASAIVEGQKAISLRPSSKNPEFGPNLENDMARIYAQLGDADHAIPMLKRLLRTQYAGATFLTPATLRLDPIWDPIRNDPRFQELLAENAPLPEKSIAVLPFENFSDNKENAYFAAGIQDEILTRLSKIADLKVISRTSTQHYKSAPENLPEIARQLGVAHVVEGSVQRRGDTVRVNVQLIKAANDSHLWAETFDRKLSDIFSVETEVAKAIADQLRVKVTGREEQEITAKPTDNPEAYDAYLRGLAYSLKAQNSPANSLGSQKHLREAVRLDPKFALAWALLSYVDSVGYIGITLQATESLREEARKGPRHALSLQPNLGEGLVAKGYYYYAYLKDYPRAVRYFEQARPLLPNSSRIPESLAYVARRGGQWEQSESFFNQAERLDPRNVNVLSQHALSYILLRRFPEALRKLDQVLNITPDDVDTLALKASIAQAEGDLPRASSLLGPLHPASDNTAALETQVYQAILERRTDQIISRLNEILARPDPKMGYFNGELRFWLGWAQQVGGDHAAAQESWRHAQSDLKGFLQEQPENYNLMHDLALVEMGLGNKAAALAMAERAIATNPIEKDVVDGPASIEILARVAAQAGEPDRAVAALQKLLSIPYEGALPVGNAPLTAALLRLDPMFDPLRG